MAMTRTQLRTALLRLLGETSTNNSFSSTTEINDYLAQAYREIALFTNACRLNDSFATVAADADMKLSSILTTTHGGSWDIHWVTYPANYELGKITYNQYKLLTSSSGNPTQYALGFIAEGTPAVAEPYIFLYPTPSKAITLEVEYTLYPDDFDDDDAYPLWAEMFAPHTIIAEVAKKLVLRNRGDMRGYRDYEVQHDPIVLRMRAKVVDYFLGDDRQLGQSFGSPVKKTEQFDYNLPAGM